MLLHACLILVTGSVQETRLLEHRAGVLLLLGCELSSFFLFHCSMNSSGSKLFVRMAPEVMQQLHGYDFK